MPLTKIIKFYESVLKVKKRPNTPTPTPSPEVILPCFCAMLDSFVPPI